jgi:hypothetical protein
MVKTSIFWAGIAWNLNYKHELFNMHFVFSVEKLILYIFENQLLTIAEW